MVSGGFSVGVPMHCNSLPVCVGNRIAKLQLGKFLEPREGGRVDWGKEAQQECDITLGLWFLLDSMVIIESTLLSYQFLQGN